MKSWIAVSVFMVCALYSFAQDDSVAYEEYYESTDNAQESTLPILDPSEISEKKGHTTEAIEAKHFDSKKWQEVVGARDYSEAEEKKQKKREESKSKESTSGAEDKRILQRDTDDEEEFEPESSSFSLPINSDFLKVIFYILVIGIIALILFLILKNLKFKSKTKIVKAALPDVAESVTDIKELEIDRLLREALSTGNYRLAIRIYFLGLLKKLDEDGIILWKKDKTNRDYLSELFLKARYFEEVKVLTLAYEQVWYGDHALSPQMYDQIIASFKAIDQKLNESKAR